MSSPRIAAVTGKPASRNRGWFVLTLILLVIALPACFVFFMQNLTRSRILEAEAEADRLDPGWRLEDLEAARAKIPDAENSALVVIETARRMPPKWINWALPAAEGNSLYDSLQERALNLQLLEKQREGLRAKLQEAAPALDYGSKLASMPRGRFPIKWNKDAVGTLLPEQQNARIVADLFRYDAILRAEEGDLARAFNSVQAVLNAGRSLGDEPISISCIIHIACNRLALGALEGALAQGQAEPTELAKLQRLLEEEAAQPLQVIAARGDRAGLHRFLEVTEATGIDRAGYGMTVSTLGPYFDDFVDKAKAIRAHPQHLRYLTAYVEVAKQPVWKQKSGLQALPKPDAGLPSLLEALWRGGEPEKMALAFHNWQTLLGCAIVGLALERYRIGEGRWPDDLNALVPRYLASVPIDPFDGQSLRFRRVQTPAMSGIVVFSVGPNGTYDGGRLDRTNSQTTAADIGFRLWDVKDRHQQPSK